MKIKITRGLPEDVRSVLIGSEKWLARINNRKEMLPDSLFDNCDPLSLLKKIRSLLKNRRV
jgi:hypothetical protein